MLQNVTKQKMSYWLFSDAFFCIIQPYISTSCFFVIKNAFQTYEWMNEWMTPKVLYYQKRAAST